MQANRLARALPGLRRRERSRGAGKPADIDPADPGGGPRAGIAVAQLLAQLHPEPAEHVVAAAGMAPRLRAHQSSRIETSTIGRSPVAASAASISAALASRFMRRTQRMTFTRWAVQSGSRPAAWYRASDVRNVHGPAAIGAASGAKLLNSPQGALVNRKPQASSRL